MTLTKKQIEEDLKVTRLKGFQPRYKYFYQNGKFQFSAKTGQETEVWNKEPQNGEYPGSYFAPPKNKADFVDFIQWYLTEGTR